MIGVLLFVGAEIATFVVVAEQIGFLAALGLLVVASAHGLVVVWRVGLGVLADTQDRLARGEAPTSQVLDGLVVLMGGVMMCVPGFIGDALALLLMIGPLRRLVIRAAGHRVARRVPAMRIHSWRVSDTRSRPARSDSLPPSGPPGRPLPPGEEADGS